MRKPDKLAAIVVGLVTLAHAAPAPPKVCDPTGNCMVRCQRKIAYCMADAGFDTKKIQMCQAALSLCEVVDCGCNGPPVLPIKGRLMDQCFTACRNSLYECSGGDATVTIILPKCYPGWRDCMATCTPAYVDAPVSAATVQPTEATGLEARDDVNTKDIAPAVQADGQWSPELQRYYECWKSCGAKTMPCLETLNATSGPGGEPDMAVAETCAQVVLICTFTCADTYFEATKGIAAPSNATRQQDLAPRRPAESYEPVSAECYLFCFDSHAACGPSGCCNDALDNCKQHCEVARQPLMLDFSVCVDQQQQNPDESMDDRDECEYTSGRLVRRCATRTQLECKRRCMRHSRRCNYPGGFGSRDPRRSCYEQYHTCLRYCGIHFVKGGISVVEGKSDQTHAPLELGPTSSTNVTSTVAKRASGPSTIHTLRPDPTLRPVPWKCMSQCDGVWDSCMHETLDKDLCLSKSAKCLKEKCDLKSIDQDGNPLALAARNESPTCLQNCQASKNTCNTLPHRKDCEYVYTKCRHSCSHYDDESKLLAKRSVEATCLHSCQAGKNTCDTVRPMRENCELKHARCRRKCVPSADAAHVGVTLATRDMELVDDVPGLKQCITDCGATFIRCEKTWGNGSPVKMCRENLDVCKKNCKPRALIESVPMRVRDTTQQTLAKAKCRKACHEAHEQCRKSGIQFHKCDQELTRCETPCLNSRSVKAGDHVNDDRRDPCTKECDMVYGKCIKRNRHEACSIKRARCMEHCDKTLAARHFQDEALSHDESTASATSAPSNHVDAVEDIPSAAPGTDDEGYDGDKPKNPCFDSCQKVYDECKKKKGTDCSTKKTYCHKHCADRSLADREPIVDDINHDVIGPRGEDKEKEQMLKFKKCSYELAELRDDCLFDRMAELAPTLPCWYTYQQDRDNCAERLLPKDHPFRNPDQSFCDRACGYMTEKCDTGIGPGCIYTREECAADCVRTRPKDGPLVHPFRIGARHENEIDSNRKIRCVKSCRTDYAGCLGNKPTPECMASRKTCLDKCDAVLTAGSSVGSPIDVNDNAERDIDQRRTTNDAPATQACLTKCSTVYNQCQNSRHGNINNCNIQMHACSEKCIRGAGQDKSARSLDAPVTEHSITERDVNLPPDQQALNRCVGDCVWAASRCEDPNSRDCQARTYQCGLECGQRYRQQHGLDSNTATEIVERDLDIAKPPKKRPHGGKHGKHPSKRPKNNKQRPSPSPEDCEQRCRDAFDECIEAGTPLVMCTSRKSVCLARCHASLLAREEMGNLIKPKELADDVVHEIGPNITRSTTWPDNLADGFHVHIPNREDNWVAVEFFPEENARGPPTIIRVENGICANTDYGMRSSRAWRPEAYRSVKMFHDDELKDAGMLDYCRFYEDRACGGNRYTDCQGNCNLKNIFPKMNSMKCWWNTTLYPS